MTTMPIKSLAFVALASASLLLAGCSSSVAAIAKPVTSASAVAQPSKTPTPTPGAALTPAAYLAKLQSYGALSVITAATVDKFSTGICDALKKNTSAQERLGSVLGIAMVAKVQFDQGKEVLGLVAAQYCPDQSALVAAVQKTS